MSVTMPAVTAQIMAAIQQVQTECPGAQFVIGGRGLSSQIRSLAGVGVCERVSEVVDAVDASVKHAELN